MSRHTRGLARAGAIPSWCATCLDDSNALTPQYAVSWGGRTVIRWLCWTCLERGDLATLATFEVRDPELGGVPAKSKGGVGH